MCRNMLYRTFREQKPLTELVTSGIDALHTGILENLASKRMSPTIIPFRHDVFWFLFKKKGTTTDDGRYIFLNKEDFVRCSWDGQRDQLLDKLGDGVRPDYPIKVRPFVSQSPRNYILSDGQMKPSPQYYTERLSIHCRKQPFTVL